MSMQAAAHKYVQWGLPVLPLKPESKAPATEHGFHDASTEPEQIEAWFGNGSRYNIGIAVPGGCVVLDIEDQEALSWLGAMDYEVPTTATARTPRGGWHFWFRVPKGVKLRQGAGEIQEHIDTRVGGAGLVAAAPSVVHYPKTGHRGRYTWETKPSPENIADCPQWLIDLTIERPKTAPRERREAGGVIGAFNGAHTVEEILERRGYQRDEHHRPAGDVVARYLAPGSTSGLAGVIVFADGNVYSHHSKAHDPLAGDHAHDAFSAFTILEHGGNVQAAVRAAAGDPKVREKMPPPPAEAGPSQSDLAYARTLCAMFGDELRHVVPWKKWLFWDGTRWAVDDSGHAWRCAKAVADATAAPGARPAKVESWNGMKAMLALAATEPGIAVSPDELDADPYLFNVSNGTLDLNTGKLRPHDRADLLTKVAGAAYDPAAKAPEFQSFMEEIQPDPAMRQFLARLFGHAMLGTVVEHVLAILYGTGANGKSTLSEAVCKAFGDYARPVDPGLLVDRGDAHPTGVASLFGLRLAMTHELDAGRRLAEATVKRLTGGDRIAARRMREDFWEFDPSHSIVMHTNHRPVVRGTDEGIWRRLRLVPFDVVIPEGERDVSLPDKLAAESDGILAWVFDGYQSWAEKGLCEPEAVTDATEEFRTDSDDLGRFIDERCVQHQMAHVQSSVLFNAWVEWCRQENVTPGSNKAFSTEVEKRGFEKHKSNGVWVWDGLGLHTEATA